MDNAGVEFYFVDLDKSHLKRLAKVPDVENDVFKLLVTKGGWKYFEDKAGNQYHAQIPIKNISFLTSEQIVNTSNMFKFTNVGSKADTFMKQALGEDYLEKEWKLTSVQGQRKTVEDIDGTQYTVTVSKKCFAFNDGKARVYIDKNRTETRTEDLEGILGSNCFEHFYVYMNYDGMRATLVREVDGEEKKYIITIGPKTLRFIGEKAPIVDWRDKPHRRIYLDFETEGLKPTHRILQMSMFIEEEGEKNVGVDVYVEHEEYDIDPGASKVHGIKNTDWRTNHSGVTEKDMVKEIITELRPDKLNVLIGHYAKKFDFLHFFRLAEKHGLGIPENVCFEDTCFIARSKLPGRHNLAACMETLGLSEADARTLALETFEFGVTEKQRKYLEKNDESCPVEEAIKWKDKQSLSSHSSLYDVCATKLVFDALETYKK